MDILAQLMIGIFGCSAIFVVGLKNESVRKWGYVLGLCSQPFWFYTTIHHQQWGIALLSLFYTYSWAQGVWNFIIAADEIGINKWDLLSEEQYQAYAKAVRNELSRED